MSPFPAMVTLELSFADLLRCRFAISPVSEVLEMVRALPDPAARPTHSDWLRRHSAQLRRVVASHDLRPLLTLLPPRGYSPGFLRPLPTGPVGEIGAELDQIAATSEQR